MEKENVWRERKTFFCPFCVFHRTNEWVSEIEREERKTVFIRISYGKSEWKKSMIFMKMFPAAGRKSTTTWGQEKNSIWIEDDWESFSFHATMTSDEDSWEMEEKKLSRLHCAVVISIVCMIPRDRRDFGKYSAYPWQKHNTKLIAQKLILNYRHFAFSWWCFCIWVLCVFWGWLFLGASFA